MTETKQAKHLNQAGEPEFPRSTRYHHGDLRATLLKAAEAELIESGLERFSLRGVAKRAGVSHAAPAHHFGDITGLLTALAAIGLDRLREAQETRQDLAALDATEQLTAAGLGYIDFALSDPALFKLVFISERPNRAESGYVEALDQAFTGLQEKVARVAGASPGSDPAAHELLRAAWAMVHGLSILLVTQNLPMLTALPKAERDTTLRSILQRVL